MPNETNPTVTVSDRGEMSPGSFRQGLADLLDFAALPARIAVLPPGAPTAIGMIKTWSSSSRGSVTSRAVLQRRGQVRIVLVMRAA